MLVRERLAALLKAKKWNQSDLARELGEHRNWVGDRIRGDTDIRADELPRIASALGLSPCAFFEEVQPAPTTVRLDNESIERIGEAVARRVKAIVSEEQSRRRPWTDEEIDRLMDYLTRERLREILERLPRDEQEWVRQIAGRRRELREREIPPDE